MVIRTLEDYEKSDRFCRYFQDDSLRLTIELYGASNFGLFSQTTKSGIATFELENTFRSIPNKRPSL